MADARQNVFADTGPCQTVRQRVEYGIVNSITGEIVAGEKRDIQNHKKSQHRQGSDKPPGVATRFAGINQYRGKKQRDGE